MIYARPALGVLVTADDAGFVTMMGGSAKADGTVVASAKYNYSVGFEEHYSTGALFSPLAPMDRKNYFVFDLTSVTTPISSAVMTLYAGPDIAPAFPGGTHGYESADSSETYVITDTPTQSAALGLAMSIGGGASSADYDSPTDPLVVDAKALHAMLAPPGPPLTSKVVTAADDGTILSLSFTPAGLTFLNSKLGSKILLGGFLSTAPPYSGPTAFPQAIFGFTGPDIPADDPLTPTLDLTLTSIPEASGALFFAVAFSLTGAMSLRRDSRRTSRNPSPA
jgi:hypothetical protein